MLKKKPETAAQGEQIQQVPVAELHPFKDHPFKVLDDEAMMKTVESMARFGVLNPLIVRPRAEGGYEIISGHRRQHAARLAGMKTLPVIVRQLDDDQAILQMVESNLQRETIRPSERAFAYKMKMEVLKHQGARTDLTLSQVGTKLRSDEKVAQEAGESRNQVQRYIRLTHLIPELLELVDQKKISFNPAVELSYLTDAEQRDFFAGHGGQQAPAVPVPGSAHQETRACLKTLNYCFFLPKKGCLLCLKGLKYRRNFAVFFLIFTLLG